MFTNSEAAREAGRKGLAAREANRAAREARNKEADGNSVPASSTPLQEFRDAYVLRSVDGWTPLVDVAIRVGRGVDTVRRTATIVGLERTLLPGKMFGSTTPFKMGCIRASDAEVLSSLLLGEKTNNRKAGATDTVRLLATAKQLPHPSDEVVPVKRRAEVAKPTVEYTQRQPRIVRASASGLAKALSIMEEVMNAQNIQSINMYRKRSGGITTRVTRSEVNGQG
jgi:hypothetical protein